MKIGEELKIGTMGQQPMHIFDASVDPEHAILRMTGEDTYQIEDLNSKKGVYVFGMRVKRKTIRGNTPILIGSLNTTVQQLLQDNSNIDLQKVWDEYDKEKRIWDRKVTIANRIPFLGSILTGVVLLGCTNVVGKEMDGMLKGAISLIIFLLVLWISIKVTEKISAKKNLRMAVLNEEMKTKYQCPYCHSFLGLVPYQVLKQKRYCPNKNCNCPLP